MIKGSEAQKKGHANFYECCDLTEKVYLIFVLFLKLSVYYDGQVDFEKSGMLSMWYTNGTWITIDPTIEDHMRTFTNTGPEFQSRITSHPWMAPGAAPVFSACGIAGGNPYGCALGDPMGPGQDCGGVFKGGFSYGPRAEDFNFPNIVTTEWTRYVYLFRR